MFGVITRSTLRRAGLAAASGPTVGSAAYVQQVRWVSKKRRRTTETPADNASGPGEEQLAAQPSIEGSSSVGGSSGPSPAEPEKPDFASLPSLDIELPTGVQQIAASPESASEPQRTGARSSRDTLSPSESSRRSMRRTGMAVFGLILLANLAYTGRALESDQVKEIEDSRKRREIIAQMTKGRTSPHAHDLDPPPLPDLEKLESSALARMRWRVGGFLSYFTSPPQALLLPPPLAPPQGKPYTLVVSLDDLLITSTWDRVNGWRTAKRPGVDYFLAYISQFYEVVVWTGQNGYTAAPILDKLDRYNFFVSHRLFRESTSAVSVSPFVGDETTSSLNPLRYIRTSTKTVKDLSHLNRDVSKIVVLDTDPDHTWGWEENAIIIDKWKGEAGETWGSKPEGLVAMIPFLESLAIFQPVDVRPILSSYLGKNIPLEYGKVEAAAKKQWVEDWYAKNPSRRKKANVTHSGNLFGVSRDATIPLPPTQATLAKLSAPGPNDPPLTYLESKRLQAQRHYLEEKAYIEKNKQWLENLLEKEKEEMMKLMGVGPGGGSLWGMLAGPPPHTPQAPGSQPPPTEKKVHIP